MSKKSMGERLLAGVLSSALLLGMVPAEAFAVGEQETETGQAQFAVDSLTLQPGSTTEAVNLNWYAPQGTTNSMVQFGEFVVEAEEMKLTMPTELKADKYTDTGKVVCKATVTGLQADTQYDYRISNDGGASWSQQYVYQTPSAQRFTFAFTSDPQIKESGETNAKGWNPSDGTNQTGWDKMMETIGKSGATLVVSAGDQVEDQSWGKSSEYAAFFAPEEMSAIAYAPAVGNHDRHYMFADHFNLPNEMQVTTDSSLQYAGDILQEVKTTFRGQNSGTSQSHGNYIQATAGEIAGQSASNGVRPNAEGRYDFTERREMETKGNYYYLYNNVLFVTLNTGAYPGGNDEENSGNEAVPSAGKDNSEAEAIVANFAKTIRAAKAQYAGQYDWLIVTHHKSTQTVAKHAADSDIENYVDAGFEELMAAEDVDVVLGGHDHVYSRSYILNGKGERVSERLDSIHDPQGVLYLTGNCCSDMQYYTPFEKLDKNNNADYPVLANGEKGSAAYLAGQQASQEERAGYLPVGNQEWNQEYSPSYALITVDGDKLEAKVYNLDGDGETPVSKEIDAFTIFKDADGGSKQTGMAKDGARLGMTQIARYDSTMTNADGGVMEIVDYNRATGWAYAVNGQSGKLTAIALKNLQRSDKVALLDGKDIDVKALVNGDGFTYGDLTSVAISPDGAWLAAAVQAEDYAANGRIVLFACQADGTLHLQKILETGVQPDMVMFTPDGSKVLTANEGEPREGYGQQAVDPAGSVTIADIKTGTVKTVGFDGFQRENLIAQQVLLKKDASVAADLEPEYIAAANDTAYVTLQEANAIAVLDLSAGRFTGIYSAGFADYSKTPVDIDKEDQAYHAKTYDSLRGLRMPDGISLYEAQGKRYLLTANEGDSRDWPGYCNEDMRNFGKKKTSPSGAITAENSGLRGKVVFVGSKEYEGLAEDRDYIFGGRSFTIFEVTENGLKEVFDSGDALERKTAAYLPDYFNCSNDEREIDDRSGKKGPEPETVTVGTVGEKTYAFVGLERIGGVMAYDITQPNQAAFANYINSRDFSADIAGDDSPEGLKFIAAADSPTQQALLLAACEVSGTVAVYELTELSGGGSHSSSGGGGAAAGNTVNGVTVTSPDSSVSIRQATVDSAILSAAQKAAQTADGVTVLGGAVRITAQKDGKDLSSFADPLTVTVPVRKDGVKDFGKLTLAQVVTDTTGAAKLIYVGGRYNASKQTLTAYVDEPGNYVLVEDSDLCKLELKLGSNVSTVNGRTVTCETAPLIINGRTMVPLRLVSEALGTSVTWQSAARTVVIKLPNETLMMTVGKTIEGFDTAPVIRNGRTMVPIRYVAEKLQANVIWVPQTQEIVIAK